MPSETTVEIVRSFVIMISAASLIVLVARRLGIPDELPLLVLGLVAAIGLPSINVVTPELVLFVLLPGLVFEAAFRLDITEFRRALWAVGLLAIPGVVLSAGVVALVLTLTIGLSFGQAFVVGAIVSATDPASVVATFTRLRAPKRLATLVQGESLLNDGTGIALFVAALGFVDGGLSAGGALVSLIVAPAASVVLGLGLGYLASRVIALTDDFVVEITISIALAYGAYALADSVGLSGVIATVVSGIVLGNYGRRVGMSERTRGAIDAVWSVAAFILTALVFLLIGIAIHVDALIDALDAIAWGTVAILVARAIVVYGVIGITGAGLGRLGRDAIPLRWQHVMFWSGLRGAVAVAMALSLPHDFPERELVRQTAFGIVLVTLIVQGATASAFVRRALGNAPSQPVTTA